MDGAALDGRLAASRVRATRGGGQAHQTVCDRMCVQASGGPLLWYPID